MFTALTSSNNSGPEMSQVKTGLPAGNRKNGNNFPFFLQRQADSGLSEVEDESQIQAKLTIGETGDEYEQEADQVADTVMRMPAPGLQATPAGVARNNDRMQQGTATPLYLQRMCAECELEQESTASGPEIQAKAEPGFGSAGGSHIATMVKSASGGRPVPDHVRARTEPVLAADLSGVRVHDDAQANRASADLNAKAFTHKNHIWLGAGQSADDVGLMAHELTHTLQQQGTNSCPGVQRLDPDFKITGLSREGDASKIYFEAGSSVIPASQNAKLSALAAPSSQNLTLFGYSSEEGPAAANAQLVNRRIGRVSRALYNSGHRATRSRRPRTSDGSGQLDYRSLRAVQVLPTPAPVGGVPVDPTPSIDPCAGPAPLPDDRCGTALRPCTNSPADVTSCGSAFNTAFGIAANWVITAVGRLASSDPATIAATAIPLAQLFPSVPRTTVLNNLVSIMLQVLNSSVQHRCHNSCDGGCDRPAYNSGTGIGSSGAVMTLCPGFINGSNTTFNAETLVHEATHGTAGVSTRDLGYGSSRLIANMTGADALRNTDSYVSLIRLLHTPGSVTVGPEPADRDDIVGMNAAEESAARSAVAYLESWLNYGSFDTALIYGAVNRSVPPATQWSGEGSDPTHEIPLMHQLSSLFGLTDPGAAAPFNNANLPTEEDKNKLAAIHDRYDRMYSSVDREKLTVTKGGAASDSWGADSDGFRLQNSLTVGPAFFALSLEGKVLHLLRLMASGLPDISSAYLNAYATGANRIRRKRTLGP